MALEENRLRDLGRTEIARLALAQDRVELPLAPAKPGDGEVGLEGPSFVWYFRGAPHVHVWVNIADSSDAKITTAG